MVCLEGLSLIAGLVILITGKFNLFGKRKLEGNPARIIGVILMLPPLIPFLIGFAAGLMFQITGGNLQSISEKLSGLLPVSVMLLILISALVAATLVAWKIPHTPATALSLPPVLTVAEAATYLKISGEELLQLVERGDLPARKIGDEVRLDRQAVIEFAQKRTSISLAEMMGSMNPRTRNTIIGALIGLAVCGGLSAGSDSYALGIGLNFGPLTGALVGFLITRK